ncbi:MAG: serine/threonine protein kinase, partial [Deltaproteobacteria bacterium]
MEAPSVGAVIGGRYRLEEELGGGAMGCVFRGSVIAGGEDVAIKVIAPELVGRGDLVERLEREALLVHGVDHPAIRRVHEYGTTDDGVPFLVSELLEGQSLDERLSREPALTGADMLRLTIDVLGGLEVVHAAGVVHRDM